MTRDEAVEKLRAVKDRGDYTFKQTVSAHGFVDGLVALGLLKFTEPKAAEEILREKVEEIDGGCVTTVELFEVLERNGLRVVPA